MLNHKLNTAVVFSVIAPYCGLILDNSRWRARIILASGGVCVVSEGLWNGSRRVPHVVVVGNHKGGTGKSTLSMHLIIALLRQGQRVASLDLDFTQRTLTRYIENRREWAARRQRPLELPEHRTWSALKSESDELNAAAESSLFVSSLAALQDSHDFIVIDTACGDHRLGQLAHAMADTLITPINDSFVDLDLIMSIAPSNGFKPVPSRYAEMVAATTRRRIQVSGRAIDWVVTRNRTSSLGSRNEGEVRDLLEHAAAQLGFRIVPGLTERVVFRELFPLGLTAFDTLDQTLLQVKPTVSHVLARREISDLVGSIGLLPKTASPPEEAAGSSITLKDADLRASDTFRAALQAIETARSAAFRSTEFDEDLESSPDRHGLPADQNPP